MLEVPPIGQHVNLDTEMCYRLLDESISVLAFIRLCCPNVTMEVTSIRWGAE